MKNTIMATHKLFIVLIAVVFLATAFAPMNAYAAKKPAPKNVKLTPQAGRYSDTKTWHATYVSWGKVKGASQYRVEYEFYVHPKATPHKSKLFASGGKNLKGQTSTYTKKVVVSNKKYKGHQWKVRVRAKGGKWSDWEVYTLP